MLVLLHHQFGKACQSLWQVKDACDGPMARNQACLAWYFKHQQQAASSLRCYDVFSLSREHRSCCHLFLICVLFCKVQLLAIFILDKGSVHCYVMQNV